MKYILSLLLSFAVSFGYAQKKETSTIKEQIQQAKNDTIIVATLENYETEVRNRKSYTTTVTIRNTEKNAAVINGVFCTGEEMNKQLSKLSPSSIISVEVISDEKKIREYTKDEKIKKIVLIKTKN